MGTKNRAQDQNRRRQKAAAKAKERASRIKPAAKYHVSNAAVAAMTAEMFPDDQWKFWASHGVNYLMSDLESGTWTPLFEGIYEGRVPSPTEIAHSLVAKYGPDNDSWPQEAKVSLGWLTQSREVGFIYKNECIKRLTAAGDADPETTARLPHNGIVWSIFDELKKKLVERKTI